MDYQLFIHSLTFVTHVDAASDTSSEHNQIPFLHFRINQNVCTHGECGADQTGPRSGTLSGSSHGDQRGHKGFGLHAQSSKKGVCDYICFSIPNSNI